MKKPWSAMLSLGLALALTMMLGIPGVQAAPGDTVLFDTRSVEETPNMYVSSAAIAPNGVYTIVNDESLYLWRPGEEAPSKLYDLPATSSGYYYFYDKDYEPTEEEWANVEKTVHQLAYGDGAVWGLNLVTMAVAKIEMDGIAWQPVKLDAPNMKVEAGEFSYARELRSAFVFENGLFWLLGPENEDEWDKYTLMRFDLATGARQEYDIEGVMTAAPYLPGKLLLGVVTDKDVYPQASSISAFDIAGGKLEAQLLKNPVENYYQLPSMTYDEAGKKIFYIANSQVMALGEDGKVETAAYLPFASAQSGYVTGLLEGGYFAVRHFDGIYVRNLDPQYKVDRALRIQGAWDDELFRAFTKDHPEIPVVLIENYAGGSGDIAEAIKNGDNQVDIFCIPHAGGLRSLMEKGYAADLSSSPKLMEDVGTMYPQVASLLKDKEGSLLAFPQYLSVSNWQVDMAKWEAFFPGETVPTTFDAFFDYYLRYEAEHPDDEAEVAFYRGYGDKADLVQMVINQYIRYYENGSAPLDFANPILRSVLEKIDQLPYEPLDYENMTQADWDMINERNNRLSIFMPYSYGMFTDSAAMRMYGEDGQESKIESLLPMTFEADQAPALDAQLNVFFVNPMSQNLDLALKYLEYSVAHMNPETRYALHPAISEPLRDPYFERNQQELTKSLEEAKALLATASDDEKASIQEKIKYTEEWLADVDANQWRISPAGLASYRKMAPYMQFNTDSLFLNWDSSSGMELLYEQIQRYSNGQITLDAFVQELSNKGKMLFLEGK